MKKILAAIFFLTLFLSSAKPSLAIYDPLSVPNNRVGIHIFSEKDLNDAASLVNSSGGDWGYVTLVITEGERDHDRWQKVFDQMRRLHLIPIVRLASKASGATWEKPKNEEINNWVSFLNSLNWVIQNRYIVISNEPNHADEWGGKIDPAGYAAYLKEFSQKLKDSGPDFFVLPAGLDPVTNERGFIKGMLKAEPDIFNYVDGWTSHPYPSFGINEYANELIFLKNLGVTKNFPVFITETGWSNKNLDEKNIGASLTRSFQGQWNDPRVVAVTPFILDYNAEPFSQFSWKAPDGHFYSFYDEVKNLSKTYGRPIQITSGQILAAFAQPIIVPGSDFFAIILARNTGQSIWDENLLTIKSETGDLILKSYFFDNVEPQANGLIIFKALAPPHIGLYNQAIYLSTLKGPRITDSFPIEAALVRIDKMQIQAIFDRILGYFKGP